MPPQFTVIVEGSINGEQRIIHMAEESANTIIKLVSCDNREFFVNQRVAFMSDLIKQMSAISPETSNEIVIPDVTATVLQKVIEFCNPVTDA